MIYAVAAFVTNKHEKGVHNLIAIINPVEVIEDETAAREKALRIKNVQTTDDTDCSVYVLRATEADEVTAATAPDRAADPEVTPREIDAVLRAAERGKWYHSGGDLRGIAAQIVRAVHAANAPR